MKDVTDAFLREKLVLFLVCEKLRAELAIFLLLFFFVELFIEKEPRCLGGCLGLWLVKLAVDIL